MLWLTHFDSVVWVKLCNKIVFRHITFSTANSDFWYIFLSCLLTSGILTEESHTTLADDMLLRVWCISHKITEDIYPSDIWRHIWLADLAAFAPLLSLPGCYFCLLKDFWFMRNVLLVKSVFLYNNCALENKVLSPQQLEKPSGVVTLVCFSLLANLSFSGICFNGHNVSISAEFVKQCSSLELLPLGVASCAVVIY